MDNQRQLDKLGSAIQAKLNEALQMMTNSEVQLHIGTIGKVSITEVHAMVDSPDTHITTVYVPLMGDIVGDLFMFLDAESTTKVADMIAGNDQGTTQVLSEFEESAIKELGNITTGVIVTELANRLSISIMLTVPNFAADMAGALVDQVLIEYGEKAEHMLALQLPFTLESLDAKGSFLLLFDEDAAEIIDTKLSQGQTNE